VVIFFKENHDALHSLLRKFLALYLVHTVLPMSLLQLPHEKLISCIMHEGRCPLFDQSLGMERLKKAVL
jgi:hypothetical protein